MAVITRMLEFILFMSKYKYYFKKPKSEIVKDILKCLAVTGAVSIAATSPYFISNILKGFQNAKKYKRRRICDTFYRLKKEGCINIQKVNHQIYISLTEEGKKKAGRLQIDALKINTPKQWDGKWRMVIFDISQPKLSKREAFRGKLKELGFYPLQKSVWIHPYKCEDEIQVLKDFFGLGTKEIRVITAEKIDDDRSIIKIFKLS